MCSSILTRLRYPLRQTGWRERCGRLSETAHTELIGHTPHGLESRLFAEGIVYQRRMEETGATAAPAQPAREIRQELRLAAATEQEGDAALLNEAVIAQYQTTAGELTQWLARWEQGPGKP